MTAPTYDALRQALYDRLSVQLAVPVWSSRAPQDSEGEALTPFPYVVIVQANEAAWNTSGDRGSQFIVQIDGYARATSAQSAEEASAALSSQVREALEWYDLPAVGATWVDTLLDGVSMGWEDDGHTRRFVSLWRVTLDEA